ncbi:MAG TPA: hypothetical protein VGS22_03800 [Thermoanaerobaculia bacterium]|jgi:hypothetical protein|nr:hypothetical protein [Thermoanaerobaculia bacterium]
MASRKTLRGSTIRFVPLLLLLILGSACSRKDEFDTLFREKLAKRALACFHPLGEIKSAGPIKTSGGDSFRGTIYWQGGLSGNDYETRVEAKIGPEVATIHLLADTAPIPATDTTCLIPLNEPAVPAHPEAMPETSETSDALPPDDSSLPVDAPPPP